jgi:hypothetical protein
VRWCRFQGDDGPAYGILGDDDRIIAVSCSPFDGYKETSTVIGNESEK